MAARRVVLKISGEAMSLPKESGLDFDRIRFVAEQLVEAARDGAAPAVVVGAGNFIRGADLKEFPRVTADQMGMTATAINALALRDVIRGLGGAAEARSALPIAGVADGYSSQETAALIDSGTIAVLAGGTGNPFFTTDSACALRSLELDAALMLKATKVDGVYSADPVADSTVERFDSLTYQEVLDKKLGVMDLTAVELCRQKSIPVRVFDFQKDKNIVKAIRGEPIGTLIS